MNTQDRLVDALDFLDRVHRGLISGRISEWPGLREACGVVYQAHAAEAVQAQAAEPVAWMHPELHKRHPYADECLTTEAIDGWLPLYTHPQPAQDAKDAALLEWAASRWNAEVMHRPLANVHRRSLDDAWRQVIRHAGGDDVVICGPRHDDLVAMAKESGR